MPKTTEANAQPDENVINWNNIKKLLPYLRPYYSGMGLAIGTGILNQFFFIASSALAAYIVGMAATGRSTEEILSFLWFLGALVIGRAVMAYAEMYIVHEVAYNILVDYRNLIYKAIERIAPGYFVNKRSGDVASSAMADVEVLEWFYAHTVGAYVIAIVAPLIFLVLLAFIHWLLTLVLLPTLLLVATIPFWFSKKASKQGKEMRKMLGVVNAEVVDGVQGMREIVSFGRGKSYLQKLENHTHDLAKSQIADGKRLGLEGALLNAFMSLGMVSILFASSLLVIQGKIDPALIPAIIILSVYIFSPVANVSGTARNLGTIGAAAERIFNILQTPSPIKEQVKVEPAEPIVPSVQFDQVSFRYHAAGDDVLKQVSFTVNPSETVALVGHSGAGKTTCVNLLLRFWDINSGSIKIADYDLRDLSQQTLRKHVAIVSQDVYLFNMTIRDNIRLGKPEASDEEVEEIAKLAFAHEFLTQLPQGYETNVGERGVQLSGGQRQRIAIARALLKDAPILLMDEAVSNLDAENERAVQKAVAQLQKGRTTLVIAHRLSTIKTADRIVVLDKGRVAEIGTHEELIQRKRVYSHLIATQQKQ